MKRLLIICTIGLILGGCGKSNIPKTSKRSKTPKHLVMTQAEKRDVNYDARENQKVIEQNLKNKDKNLKHAQKQRQKQLDEANKQNATTSKVKKVKNTTFSFY
jgi:basic membrane lipoprotein Med (substrate-binding protein (PBP1-ABC) superfamily)